ESVAVLGEHEVASGKDGIPSGLTSSISSSRDVTSSIKGETDQESVGEHGVNNPPSSYNYYYPGYGSFNQGQGYYDSNGPNTGMQSENGSLVYYLSGYPPYASNGIMGVDGQGVGQQQYYSSSGYLQPAGYSWDPTFVRDVPNGPNSGYVNGKSGLRSNGLARSNGFNSAKANGNFTNKFSKSFPNAQPIKSLNKVPHLGSDFSAGLLRGYPPVGRFSSFTNQKQGLFPYNSFANYKPNGRVWSANDRFKSKDKNNRNGEFEATAELTRGPRSRNKIPSDPSVEKEDLVFASSKGKYNLPDFQTEYENAKFYVIKSYSEDDIHKCLKYDVWASTPSGNKKLDVAFRDAEAKSSEMGTNCPIFLFFSVNASGQFVGVAEMMGQVDFNKSMDFWQVDKWNGFFPVKWHIVKDIPNAQLRHIILENNENRPVTFTRDTQEIGLKQGLEMLNIFKSCTAKTSLLDDFEFYENREKTLHIKRGNKPATLEMEGFGGIENDLRKQKIEVESASSLINLTKNLSLNA
ncbi:hypothetical protein UlMin_029587, partial [Ulmus minor]